MLKGVSLPGGGSGGVPDDGSVTGAKLADALAELLPTSVVFSIVNPEPGVTYCYVAAQLYDAKGNIYEGPAVARVWLSDHAGGVVTSSLPTGNETITAGRQLQTIVAKGHWIWLPTSGAIGFRINNSFAPHTYYVNVEVNGRVYTSNAITFEKFPM